MADIRSFHTPLEGDLGLHRIANGCGLAISVLPNGCLFALEHAHDQGRILINQMLGSPLGGCLGRVLLRVNGDESFVAEAAGPEARAAFGAGRDRFVWQGEAKGLTHRLTLWLHPDQNLWLWQLGIINRTDRAVNCDAILIQDLGLGDRSFVTSNEAFASHYVDHFIARHDRYGPVIMSRQNLAQFDRHPWVAHGCFEGSASFATDRSQLLGAHFYAAGTDLPGLRLQHEAAAAILQTKAVQLQSGEQALWTFFGLYDPDHGDITSDSDLAKVEAAAEASRAFVPAEIPLAPPVLSLVQEARPLDGFALSEERLAATEGERVHEEWRNGALLSYFLPDGAYNRHVVLGRKEKLVNRRHGTLLRSGQGLLPNETTLCATFWMQGVFATQLTIGDTAFHKLFSVARDPFNAMRTSGLRMLACIDGVWRLLAIPSLFEMGLGDCRWVYHLSERTIDVRVTASGEEAALQWQIEVEGEPCAFLVFAEVVLGEKEYAQQGTIEIDVEGQHITFRPDPASLWGRQYPQAVYHLVTGTPEEIEAMGGDELLYVDGKPRGMPYVAFRTRATRQFRFSVVGAMNNPEEACRLAAKYEAPVAAGTMLRSTAAYWGHVMRAMPSEPLKGECAALRTILPWFVHNAIIHLSVPHGLEQYTGAAWGTRDVCQGPVELLLALKHDAAVKDILRRVFGRQYRLRGDWPQWFMLDPYSAIEEPHSHGDIIIWPLKALCDYIEATGDLSFLSEGVAWHAEKGAQRPRSTVTEHVRTLLEELRARFIPGTHLPRYGEGDWNDTLQPTDPRLREWMVSSWTVGLLFQQIKRYTEILRRVEREEEAENLAELARGIREDFNRFLMGDGVVAGYGLFLPGCEPELLLHPKDAGTGVNYSLIPMTMAITGGLFTPEQSRHHLRLIKEHLLFADGARLMDRPIAYHGGAETLFRRAESAAFFGREVGLMYVHAHLRYCEALAVMGETEAFREGLMIVNPIAVTERLDHAALRQRNSYFSSSDAAFHDRYEATASWDRVKAAKVTVEGGWRVYSGGAGLYVHLLLTRLATSQRAFDE